jgi:bifunctional DNA-binding transcriptional regulator/antitoxin component of YhaV-PrlF toxin-antitoxin module
MIVAKTFARSKVVRAYAKGQITVPRDFREALGIGIGTLLSVSLVGDHLVVTPIGDEPSSIRRYSEDDVARFLEEDRLDPVTARRVRDLMARE